MMEMTSRGNADEAFPSYMQLEMERQREKPWRLKFIICLALVAFILVILSSVTLTFLLGVKQDNYPNDAILIEEKEKDKGNWINITCYNESDLEVFGNRIQISEIVANLTANPGEKNINPYVRGWPSGCTKESVTKLLIFATEIIHIDNHFRQHELGLSKLQLFSLVAPYWTVVYNGVVEFDLSGRNGENATDSAEKNGNHGKPGEHGSNFVGIYTKANATYKLSSVVVKVKGGNGGNGANGLNGQDGAKGKNATVYDLPPARDAEELSICVDEEEIVSNIAPGTIVRGVVNENNTISRFSKAQNRRMWYTALGFGGENGEAGGNGGDGGASGISGEVVLLKLSSGSNNHGRLNINILEGNGNAGVAGQRGNCGKQGATGDSFSCFVLSSDRHTWCNKWACRTTAFVPQIASPNSSCNASSGKVGERQLPSAKLKIFQIINQFTKHVLTKRTNLYYEETFLQLLHNSSTVMPFLSAESFSEELFVTYRECQTNHRIHICLNFYENFLQSLKMYTDFCSKNNLQIPINEITTLDFLHTFALLLLAGQHSLNSSRLTEREDFPLHYVREKALKLERTKSLLQNIHLENENDSSCRLILHNVIHPTYDSALLGKSLRLVDATKVLQKLILKYSEDGVTLMTDLFPTFLETSQFVISIEKYLHNPLYTVTDKNCSMLIQFGRLNNEVEENLENIRFSNWFPTIANRVDEHNVLQIIQDYKLANVTEDMKYPSRRNFRATLVSTLKNAAPWLNVSCENNGQALLIYGNTIKLSWLMNGDHNETEQFAITWPQSCQLKGANKFLLFASETVYLDQSLARQNSFKSFINISIIAPKLIIEKDVILDMSGLDAESPKSKPISKCLIPGSSGENGENGASGGNGGNVFVLYSEAQHAQKLAIIVDGGSGGTGQDGADGCDGQPGKNASLENFPVTNNYWYNLPFRNELQQELLEPCGFYKSKISNNGIWKNEFMTDWATATGFPGGRGGDGGVGGNGGGGGLRGFAEVVQLQAKYNHMGQFNASISSRNGLPGAPGIGGNAGKEGVRGDNYSCKEGKTEKWTDCYSSFNRGNMYRHFKDGKAGKPGNITAYFISPVESLLICGDVHAYVGKLEKFTNNAFLSSLLNFEKANCATSAVAKVNPLTVIHVANIMYYVKYMLF